MRSEYSTYEAKAQFSEIIRQVRQGKTITVSYRGKPVAEIRPFRQGPETIEERLAEYERRVSWLVQANKDDRSRR
jgi:prevent-host-death family protein